MRINTETPEGLRTSTPTRPPAGFPTDDLLEYCVASDFLWFIPRSGSVGQLRLFRAGPMPNVLIRNVDETLRARLKASAAAHGRSLEEEARELLQAAVARQEAPERENLASVALSLFGPRNGADLNIPPRGTAPRRIAPDFRGPRYRGTARKRSSSIPT